MLQCLSILLLLICSPFALAQGNGLTPEQFVEQIANFPVGDVKAGNTQNIPNITWGAESALFEANGQSLITTAPGKYDEFGLKITFQQADDPVEQVRQYLAGERPALRMTKRMLGMVNEVISRDPRTKPVEVLFLSYSGGDHIVGEDGINKLNDLKAKMVAVQQGGPHVGLLYDALAAAGLTKNDITIVWTKGLSDGAQLLREGKVQAACVITPDMLGLTGGAIGSGAEGTVAGARVVVSTQQMSRSVVDIVAFRKDFFDANRDFCAKFVAGYLWGVEQVVKQRQRFEDTQQMSAEYVRLLTLCQTTFGEEVIPTIEVDGHGLLLDCYFQGLAGQISYFIDRGNPNGFEAKTGTANDLTVSWGYAKAATPVLAAGFDYKKIAQLAGIAYREPKIVQRIRAEAVDVFPDSMLDDRIIASFPIYFDPGQKVFPIEKYASDFDRAIKAASTFGNAVVAIRGHSDPTKTLVDFVQAGMKLGFIARKGSRGNWKYEINGVPLDLSHTPQIIKLIESGVFDKAMPNPRERMSAALNLSLARAKNVKASLEKRATQTGQSLDISQIQPVGSGILEPKIAKPTNIDEAKQNMRVDFLIISVPAEAIEEDDFDNL